MRFKTRASLILIMATLVAGLTSNAFQWVSLGGSTNGGQLYIDAASVGINGTERIVWIMIQDPVQSVVVTSNIKINCQSRMYIDLRNTVQDYATGAVVSQKDLTRSVNTGDFVTSWAQNFIRNKDLQRYSPVIPNTSMGAVTNYACNM